MLKILNNLYDEYKIENLCLAGGCALNSKFNGSIVKKLNLKMFLFNQMLVMVEAR